MPDGENPTVYMLLAEFKSENKVAHEKMNSKLDIQNTRISKLERWRSYLLGAFTTIGAILTAMLLLKELASIVSKLRGV